MAMMNIGGHISHRYDQELESLRSRVLAMGGLAERQINDALTAVMDSNTELAEYVIRTDHRVNAQEVSIDEDCTYILARRQPTAGDLRMVMAIIKTITDIERIGDESEKIARMAVRLAEDGEQGFDSLRASIDELGQIVRSELHETLDAFVRLNVDAAVAAALMDNEVDRLYIALLEQLIDRVKEEPAAAASLQNMIWIVRSLERIGDHAKNICEYVIYLVRGKDVRHISIDEVQREISE